MVGDNSSPYTGTFDGNEHTISNLDIADTTENANVGMFEYIGENGKVQNLTLTHAYISGNIDYSYAGSITVYNSGTITNCYLIGSVSGSSYVGGIAGFSIGPITACYSIIEVTDAIIHGSAFVGGIAGIGTNVTACYWSSSNKNLTDVIYGYTVPTTKVDGNKVTWAGTDGTTSAMDEMNNALKTSTYGKGYKYVENRDYDGDSDPCPLLVEAK